MFFLCCMHRIVLGKKKVWQNYFDTDEALDVLDDILKCTLKQGVVLKHDLHRRTHNIFFLDLGLHGYTVGFYVKKE